MTKIQLRLRREEWPFRSEFRIAYRTRTHAQSLIVELWDGDVLGRGEASGVSYHGETIDSLVADIETMRSAIEAGLTREELQSVMPPGGGRNALDCAMWDLEAKLAGQAIWELAGLPKPSPLTTAYTLSLDVPERMAAAAEEASQYSRLKIKLGDEGDLERVAAVRRVRPDADIIVDANQAWNDMQLRTFVPALAQLGVSLIEQPMPIGKDQGLSDFDSPVPLCADESCQTVESLPDLIGKYQFINIKLDKTGGLTEAVKLATAARSQGMRLMVGCMAGSSLAMAPAFFIGQLCEVVDLDAPLLLDAQMPSSIRYSGSTMHAPVSELWG